MVLKWTIQKKINLGTGMKRKRTLYFEARKLKFLFSTHENEFYDNFLKLYAVIENEAFKRNENQTVDN